MFGGFVEGAPNERDPERPSAWGRGRSPGLFFCQRSHNDAQGRRTHGDVNGGAAGAVQFPVGLEGEGRGARKGGGLDLCVLHGGVTEMRPTRGAPEHGGACQRCERSNVDDVELSVSE
jgi:hypothetical protein